MGLKVGGSGVEKPWNGLGAGDLLCITVVERKNRGVAVGVGWGLGDAGIIGVAEGHSTVAVQSL